MSSDEWNPRTDPQFDDFLRGERMAIAAQTEARRLEMTEAWSEPPMPTSLYDQNAQERPKVDWVIEDFAPAGVLNMNGEAKAGKTTVILGAIHALTMQEPFLGKFRTNLNSDERVGILNMELPEGQFNSWFDKLGLSDDAQKRIVPYHALTHGFSAVEWSDSRAVDWTVKWLRDSGITVMFADPTAKLFNPAKWGGDPNSAYTAWFMVVQDIARRAGLRLVWLNTHTGFSAEAADRSRGASSMMDNATVNLVLRHNGPYGKPPGHERWLGGRGRDVDLAEFEIVYDPTTRLYRATGNGSRAEVGGEQMQGHRALQAWDALAKYHRTQRSNGVVGDIEVTAGKLSQLAGVRETDRHSSEFRSGRNLAVDRGWLAQRKQGTSTLLKIGEITPPERESPDAPPPKNRLSLRAIRGDNDDS